MVRASVYKVAKLLSRTPTSTANPQHVPGGGDNESMSAGPRPQVTQRKVTSSSSSGLFRTQMKRGRRSVIPRERMWTCSFEGCDATFYPREYDKRRHEGTHTKEVQHVCNYCGTAFNQITQLKNHERNRHTHEELPCGVSGCKLGFKDASTLSRHRTKYHPGWSQYYGRLNKANELKQSVDAAADQLSSLTLAFGRSGSPLTPLPSPIMGMMISLPASPVNSPPASPSPSLRSASPYIINDTGILTPPTPSWTSWPAPPSLVAARAPVYKSVPSPPWMASPYSYAPASPAWTYAQLPPVHAVPFNTPAHPTGLPHGVYNSTHNIGDNSNQRLPVSYERKSRFALRRANWD